MIMLCADSWERNRAFTGECQYHLTKGKLQFVLTKVRHSAEAKWEWELETSREGQPRASLEYLPGSAQWHEINTKVEAVIMQEFDEWVEANPLVAWTKAKLALEWVDHNQKVVGMPDEQ